ncbi:site-specific DNA-methyltransferase [candidate division KSB1 bacterium]|nr:site-specific DNA-methyltransferase [candidate division KSB1 bacterium]
MPTLDWIGKEAVLKHHKDVPFRLLNHISKLSYGDPVSGNMLIEGDNLEALKALLPYYKGKVKCIYIDPPYNTGNEHWIYNDNVNSPQMKKWLGKIVDRDDLSRHDKWLCMLYPRLKLLKNFLDKSGSIWVSIDDSEVQNMRIMLDDIFGKDKFIACNVWQKRYSRENREAIGDVHEYILVYAIEPKLFKNVRNRVTPTETQLKVYKNPNNDPKGRWRPIPMNAQGYRPNQMYPIKTPSGAVHHPPEGRCWSMIEQEYKKLLSKKRIYFGKNNDSQPNVIRYIDEVEGFVPWTWWPNEEVGHTDEAKKEIHALFGKDNAFDTPKPERLIQRILEIATNPNDIVLDSFLGSGTTVAVAQKMGRHYIGVEMEKHAETLCAIRLKKVVNGEQGGISKTIDWTGGGGYNYYRLGETVFSADGKINPDISFTDLARHLFFNALNTPIPDESQLGKSPLLGIYNNVAVYLLYNGILKDKTPNGGNALTRAILASLPKHSGSKIIFGTSNRLSPKTLKLNNITFRQIPYQIRVD